MGRNYFEREPWDQALACLGGQEIENIAEISIHCTCQENEFEMTEKRWKERITSVLGKAIRCDELKSPDVISCLARYENKAIVRMFFDKGGTGVCENFEIVTKNALIIWKPDVHPQGRISYAGADFCDFVQPYSITLRG
jgi:hypothetical protein